MSLTLIDLLLPQNQGHHEVIKSVTKTDKNAATLPLHFFRTLTLSQVSISVNMCG